MRSTTHTRKTSIQQSLEALLNRGNPYVILLRVKDGPQLTLATDPGMNAPLKFVNKKIADDFVQRISSDPRVEKAEAVFAKDALDLMLKQVPQ